MASVLTPLFPPTSDLYSHAERSEQGFWFANFTVGASPSLEILIDSGSSDAIMNPGVYKPSANSQNLNKTFQVSYATTNPDGSGTETATGPEYKDVIGLPGTSLSVSAQTLGAITSPQSPPTFPHDGLIGFAGISSLGLDATSWFQSLCNAGTVSPCRFGLAFKTDNTGTQYFGSLPTDVYNGSLSTAPIIDEWGLEGDVVVNGKVVQSSATILTDSGTTVVFGPVASVQAIFKAAGIQYVTNNGSNGTPTTVDGYYPCDQPPKLGFAFPSASQAGTGKASKTSTIFNIDSVPLAQTMNGNNCTAILHGTDEFSFWLVGQGKYLLIVCDHAAVQLMSSHSILPGQVH